MNRESPGFSRGECQIIKIEDQGVPYYLEWSTIVDAPVTYGLSLEEFTEYYRDRYGSQSMEWEFAKRMKRVEQKGTSSMMHGSADEVISFNRAGENESCLSREDIIEKYIRNRPKE